MLYSRIESSVELRANITTLWRARGYVTEDDLQTYANGTGYQDVGNGMQNGFGSQDGQLLNRGMAGAAGNGANSSLNSFQNSDSLARGGDSSSPYAERNTRQIVDATHLREAITEPQILRRPTPYNLLSLRDLYTQLPERTGQLKRFGSDFFTRRDGFPLNQIAPSGRGTPLDVPAGPDYIVGPGDSLTIDLWGGISQSLTRMIDREGRIALPESGAVQIAGLTLERVQGVIVETLKHQYRDLQVAVTVSRLRSIRVYVVGDVQRPGAYDISSLSTSLNALFAAGGPPRLVRCVCCGTIEARI
jgi:hypothetical protein